MQHTKSECSRYVSILTIKSMQHVEFSTHFLNYYAQSKFCQRDNLFISRIFCCTPLMVSCASVGSHYVKIRHFSNNPLSKLLIKKQHFRKNTEIKCLRRWNEMLEEMKTIVTEMRPYKTSLIQTIVASYAIYFLLFVKRLLLASIPMLI